MLPVTRTAVYISFRTLSHTASRLCRPERTYHGSADIDFESENLLSDENRQRCLESMKRSAPINIKLKGNVSESTFAAVLIAICTDEYGKNLSLLYTTRSRNLRRHMSQISFPGGIKDEGEDFIQCALREAEEEIGLSDKRVEIWGAAGLVRPPHTAAIMPVIGVVRNFEESELKLNPSEVEEAFTVPISYLANPNNFRYTQFKSGYSSPVFVVGTKRIWGVTGFITNMFLNCLLTPKINLIKGRVAFVRPYRTIVK